MSESLGMRLLLVPCGEPGFLACRAAYWLWWTVPFLLLAVGTVGNLLSLTVLSRQRMRKNVTTMYLMCLAVSDLVFIWAAVINVVLRLKNIDVKLLSIFNCKLHEWVTSWSICLSVWLMVLLTKERLLLTVFPLKAKRYITKEYVVTSMTLTIVMTSLISCHFVFGNTLQEKHLNATDSPGVETWCGPSSEEYSAFRMYHWSKVLMVVYSIIPFLLICTGNVIIAVTLYLQRRRVHPIGNRNEKTKAFTKILFILSACFLLTTTPYGLFRIIYFRVQNSLSDSEFAKFQLYNAIVTVCLMSNSAINFILYCVGGTLFRSELKALIIDMRTRCACNLFHRRIHPVTHEASHSRPQAFQLEPR